MYVHVIHTASMTHTSITWLLLVSKNGLHYKQPPISLAMEVASTKLYLDMLFLNENNMRDGSCEIINAAPYAGQQVQCTYSEWPQGDIVPSGLY